MRYLILAALLAACSLFTSPMVYDHGVPNLVQVHPNVYRSGQTTTQAGWDYIQQLAAGRKVRVIKLNYPNEGSDQRAVEMGMIVYEMPIQPEGDQDVLDDLRSAWMGPDEGSAQQIEELLASAKPDELWLVHCTHGQDRTGYVIGRYRVEHDGWTPARAYNEMRANNFHVALHGVHEAWEQFAKEHTP